jgi:hypothetical protein
MRTLPAAAQRVIANPLMDGGKFELSLERSFTTPKASPAHCSFHCDCPSFCNRLYAVFIRLVYGFGLQLPE